MHPSFPQPFHYPGSTNIDPARQRGMGNTPHATANPVPHTDYPPQGSSAGRFPVPQLPSHPPAHIPAWGGGHPPAFPTPTPAAHGPRIPSVPPPPTMQREATMSMPGHPPVFPTTMPMAGQLVNQEATPHHHLYVAQPIPRPGEIDAPDVPARTQQNRNQPGNAGRRSKLARRHSVAHAKGGHVLLTVYSAAIGVGVVEAQDFDMHKLV
ncbi:hypothetical protein BJV78DRAFT_1154796 [Lactifluus subvellereus]|nr:hypothetical protein BJV78DRAFT_1154796 [Lactifluus subvellereus]